MEEKKGASWGSMTGWVPWLMLMDVTFEMWNHRRHSWRAEWHWHIRTATRGFFFLSFFWEVWSDGMAKGLIHLSPECESIHWGMKVKTEGVFFSPTVCLSLCLSPLSMSLLPPCVCNTRPPIPHHLSLAPFISLYLPLSLSLSPSPSLLFTPFSLTFSLSLSLSLFLLVLPLPLSDCD